MNKKLKKLLEKINYMPEMSLKWNIGCYISSLTYPFRRVFNWITKCFQYSKLLWSDHDWDHIYFFILMQYKLKRMREALGGKNGHSLEADMAVAQIKHAEDLMEKWMNGDFCQEEYAAHDKKWGEANSVFTPLDDSDFLEWHMHRANATTPEEEEQASKEYREILEKEHIEKEKCLDEIFAHIRKYIQCWWD